VCARQTILSASSAIECVRWKHRKNSEIWKVSIAVRFSHHGIELSCFTTITAISAKRWDSLSGANSFYLSHDWLEYVEQDCGTDVCYLVTSQSGDVRAALPVYLVHGESNPNYKVSQVSSGRLMGRYLIAGTRRGYANELLLGSRVNEFALHEVLDEAEHRAAMNQLDGTAFLYLGTHAAQQLRQLRHELRPVLLGIDTELAVPGESFDDYLFSLDKKRSWGVQKERRLFRKYQISICRLSDCYEEAGPLVAAVQQKYGHVDTPDSCRRALRAQADVLDPYTVVFTARKNGQLVAFSLFYSWRDTLYGRATGFDYGALDDGGEYFNVYFYEPLDYAYRHGYKRLDLGRGSYAAKLRRGARARARWAAVIPTKNSIDGAGLDDWREFNGKRQHDSQQRWHLTELDVPKEWTS